MQRNHIDKIAHTPEDRLLLAKLWDKILSGIHKNIMVNTCFLTPRELEMSRYLFGNLEGLHAFGGYADAERQMLCWIPEYWDETVLQSPDSPLVCLRASFWDGATPTHRDFLGALMGAGLARESIGDICVGTSCCDFFVTAEIAPYILQNLLSAGRAKLSLEQIPLAQVVITEPQTLALRDTVASLRLDSVIASGFRIGRSAAVQYISAGKVSIDGLPCEKPDKPLAEGVKISVRGLGKIKLKSVNGLTKKGRTAVVIDRYV